MEASHYVNITLAKVQEIFGARQALRNLSAVSLDDSNLSGDVNKIYFVSAVWKDASPVSGDTVHLVLKVTNPLWKERKTENQVAVTKYVAKNTSIPVPEIIDFCTSSAEFGFEYILMNRIRGEPLRDVFATLTEEIKLKCVRRMAEFAKEMMHVRFDRLGGFDLHMKITNFPDGSNLSCSSVASYLGASIINHLEIVKREGRHLTLVDRLTKYKE